MAGRDFVDMRKVELEKYLMRLAKHPTLQRYVRLSLSLSQCSDPLRSMLLLLLLLLRFSFAGKWAALCKVELEKYLMRSARHPTLQRYARLSVQGSPHTYAAAAAEPYLPERGTAQR